jgi:hypothetical protein
MDINGYIFPFIASENRTYNTCITASDFLGRKISLGSNSAYIFDKVPYLFYISIIFPIFYRKFFT